MGLAGLKHVHAVPRIIEDHVIENQVKVKSNQSRSLIDVRGLYIEASPNQGLLMVVIIGLMLLGLACFFGFY